MYPSIYLLLKCQFSRIYIISISKRYFVDRFRILTVQDPLPRTMDKKNYYLYM